MNHVSVRNDGWGAPVCTAARALVDASAARNRFVDAPIEPAACVAAQLCRTAPEGVDLSDYVATLHADDFVLASAAAAGSRQAAAALQSAYTPTVIRALRSARARDAAAADVGQRIWERVLVGSEARPASITTYSGRGALGAWLHVSVIREAHLEQQQSARFTSDSALEAEVGSGDGELEYMKKLYAAEFRAAFREALTSLSVRERSLLRYTYVDGLSADRLAVLHGVHRVSVARWLAGARATLAHETRRILTRKLGLDSAESDSVLRLIHSELDMSLSALHADADR